MRHFNQRLFIILAFLGLFVEAIFGLEQAPLFPPHTEASNELISYLSSYLSYFDCSIENALDNISKNNQEYYVQQTGASMFGGFGGQLCLHWIPKTISAMFHGAHVALNVAEIPWNYGCPGYEKASDVLINARPRVISDSEVRFNHGLVSEKTMSLPEGQSLTCNGTEISILSFRNVVANYYFKFQPYFDQRINNEILKLKLPKNYLAVHIRGGDKLVSEWTGANAGLGNPSLWARKIGFVLSYDQDHYGKGNMERISDGKDTTTLISSQTIFAESDDCNLLLDIKKELHHYNINMIHIPCVLNTPVLYTQRYQTKNITGHHQANWNSEHTCADTIRYFTGLTLFRDATVALLGTGGIQGTPRAGHGLTSNTALLIEILRAGNGSQSSPSKRTYNMLGNGGIKYPFSG